MNITDTLTHLANLTKGPHALRPCLVGPTGAGKTARVHQVAEALNLPVHTMLLAHMMPEEISGIPHVTAKRTAWPAPEWATRLAKEPHVLFLDEFDKARRDVMGAVLTLLWELKVGNVALHPDTVLILAMQPVPPAQFLADETGRAIAARCVFLPVAYDWNYVQQQIGMDLSFLPAGPSPKLPVLEEPSPRQVTLLYRLLTHLPEEVPQDTRQAIAGGVLPKPLVEPFLEALDSHQTLDSKAICQALGEGTIDPDDIELEEVIALTAVIPEHLSGPKAAETFARFTERLWETRNADLCSRFLSGLFDALEEQYNRTGDPEVEFLPGVEPDDLYDAMEPVVKRLQEKGL